ncbi:MAG TPA: hypothetical protein VF637_17110 [Sphingomicrobium sp.]
MTNSSSSLMAILFGLAVFAVIVAVGWRSVQNRRILRLRGANGQETIIVAGEDDKISSVETSSETVQSAPEPFIAEANGGLADDVAAVDSGPRVAATEAEANASGRDRLSRVVSSTK